MKIERIKTEISTRKVYVPPMVFLEDIEDDEAILAGSIPGKGQHTETGSGEEDAATPQSFFVDPVSIEDNYLDVDNYN